MQNLKIEGLSQEKAKFGIKTIIESGDKKYYFYDTKVGGSHTKAWEQFNQYGFKIGDAIQAEVKDEPFEFKGKTYQAHKIIYFGEVEHTPLVNIETGEKTIVIPENSWIGVSPKESGTKSQPEYKSGAIAQLEARVAVLEGIVLKKEMPTSHYDEIKPENLPF